MNSSRLDVLTYLDKVEHFIMNYGWRVVFGKDSFHQHTLNKFLTGD